MGNRVKGRPKKSSIKAALSSSAGSKRKLSRMGKQRKKHKAGLEATMIGRSKCLSMLQITLKDFRRLCILKGIYPREPMGRRAPNNKRAQTYYHIKDIRAIAHEPILEKFRETRAFMKKVRRAAGRREPTEATRKHSNLPTYSLHHLVKERYPRFVDALGDIDDALTLTYLFAALPATADIKPSIVKTAKHLAAAWGAYCATAHKLTKSFVSVRGVYLEARIHNTDIRWVVPHAFTQFMPETVDFRVMGTFLEFYSTLLRFVLFQLYSELGIRYPFLQSATGSTSSVVAANLRAVTSALDASSLGQVVSASIAKATTDTDMAETSDTKKGATKASLELPQLPSEDEEEDDDQDNEEMTEQLEEAFSGLPATKAGSDEESTRRGLFSGFTFFFSREVPRGYLELVCLSFGAKSVGWEAEDSPISMKDSSITHHIIDRPRLLPAHEALSSKREFVQPQWILDCANQQFILPFTRYVVGAALPPHLSPWVDNTGDGEYKPKYAEELERLKAGLPLEDEEEDEVMEEAEEEEESDEEAVPEAMKNDEEEESSDSEEESEDEEKKQEKLAKKTKKQEEEAHRLAKTMMSRKASHLYGRMQHGIAKKKAVVDTLHQKRKLIEDKEIIKGKEKDDSGKTALKQKVDRLKNERKQVEGKYNDTGGSMKKGKGKKGKSKKR